MSEKSTPNENEVPVNPTIISFPGFNKSKEDFIWFMKKASTDRKSDAHHELYQCLLKMFVDADTNRDGLVSQASFSKLIDNAASIPRAYGYAPLDADLYKTEQEKEQTRKKMFESMDLRSSGLITFDEWIRYTMDHILAKTKTLDPHPTINNANVDQFKTFLITALTVGTPENDELYWYLIEIFTECDGDKDGMVTKEDFVKMMEMLSETPIKLAMSHPDLDIFDTDAVKRSVATSILFEMFSCKEKGKMSLDEWVKLAMQGVYKKIVF